NVKYNLEKDLNLNIPVDVMTNAGIFVLDDLGIDKKNPFLYVIQGGAGSSFNDFLEWKAFIGYLDFAHIADTMSMSLVPTSASMNMNGNYRHDYDVLEVSGEVTSHFLEQQDLGTFSKPLTFFVDYVNNLAISDKDNGWEIGAKLGKKKFKKFGDWRAVYNFRRLERDSFPDDFPDADAFRGRTDGFGHEAIFSYGLAKNIWLEFDYYVFRDKTRGMDPNDKWGQIIQLDLNTKF
ncbi:MAG: putative porin, partial [Candidatus Omnitrophota bacterium]